MTEPGIWRPRRVAHEEWTAENHKHGSVYFLLDQALDMIKIGHSHTPFDRMKTLQIGSAAVLRMLGIMAAPREFETTLHQAFDECHERGEWFRNWDAITLFLHDVTHGEPICRTAWSILPASDEFWAEWDKGSKSRPVCRFDPGTAKWELVAR